MRLKKEIFASGCVSAALLALLLSSITVPPRVDKKLHAAMGRTLATEALKLIKPGGKITVIARDTEAFPQPAMDILLDRLQSDIRRGGAEVRAVEHIQLDPIRPGEVPSGDFYELLRRLPAGDVIVSLLGPPLLLAEHREKLGRSKAGLVALCTGSTAESANLEELFRAGLLHAAVVNQPPAAGAGAPSFERLYRVVRSQ